MDLKDLTNEELLKKFKSQFDMVNHAINLAENMVRSGRGPRVKVDNQNPAVIIVEEITVGKDHFEPIPVMEERPMPAFRDMPAREEKVHHTKGKDKERKKIAVALED
jgi:DNA-directed RNA polymerase subunit omega